MDFQSVVRSRRMVRAYDPGRAVAPDLLARCLDNATRAPSAGFSQGWEFVVLDQGADVDRFWQVTTDATGQPDRWLAGMQTAPVVIVPLADKERYLARYAESDKGWISRAEDRWAMPYWLLDTAMASLLILLTATDEGLSGCFFGIPPQRMSAVREAYAIPQALEPIGSLTIGYADPAAAWRSGSLRRGRRTDVFHGGRFGQPWPANGGAAADVATRIAAGVRE